MEYMTLAESFLAQAERHNLRGLFHSMYGRHAYACGAYSKGLKDALRARSAMSIQAVRLI